MSDQTASDLTQVSTAERTDNLGGEKVVQLDRVLEDRSSASSDMLEGPALQRDHTRDRNTGSRVADIKAGARDARNELIDQVFFKRRTYAIYGSSGRVLVQYADDEQIADRQIAAIAALIPLRDRLQYLMSGKNIRGCYSIQIAEALRLGLEGQVDTAKQSLEVAAKDASEVTARHGRLVYVTGAFFMSIVAAALLGTLALNVGDSSEKPGMLLFAASAGAVGALLSIAISIRSRTVAVDGDSRSNIVDGGIRIVIGIISAAVLYLALASGALANINAGAVSIVGADIGWKVGLLIGFAAGFFERLVPDLLAKAGTRASSSAAATQSG